MSIHPAKERKDCKGESKEGHYVVQVPVGGVIRNCVDVVQDALEDSHRSGPAWWESTGRWRSR
jgi:hypothetical protein